MFQKFQLLVTFSFLQVLDHNELVFIPKVGGLQILMLSMLCPLNYSCFHYCSKKAVLFSYVWCFTGDVNEAIDLYKEALRRLKVSDYIAIDDQIMEKMRVDLAELLHAVGR